MFRFIVAILCTLLQPVAAQKYFIGNMANAGAWNITDTDLDCTTLPCSFDLALGCFKGKKCPPVVIFEGKISGTIDVGHCDVGVMYSFVNFSEDDSGITVQHAGGHFGAVGISRFGVGTCFCHISNKLLCGIR